MIRSTTEAGFTLPELIVVGLIVGILAALLLPKTVEPVLQAKETSATAFVGVVTRAQQQHYEEHGTFAVSLSKLNIMPPSNKDYTFELTSTKNSAAVEAKPVDKRLSGIRQCLQLVKSGRKGQEVQAVRVTRKKAKRGAKAGSCS